MSTKKHFTKHILAVFGLLIGGIILTACNLPSRQTDQTPTPEPVTMTIFIDPTYLTPAPEETQPAETAEPTVVLSPTGCGYWAEFVEDVTVPDNSEIVAGTTFDKTWRLRNNGCQAWPPGTRLYFWGEEQLGGPEYVEVASVPVNTTADISVALTAPDEPGEYLSNWQLIAPDGSWIGPHVYVQFVVVSATPTPTPSWNPLLGTWEPNALGESDINRLEIREDGGLLYVHMWRSDGETEIDWGEIAVPSSDADDNLLSLTWTGAEAGGTADRAEAQQITVLPDGRLQITGQVNYTDPAETDFAYIEYFGLAEE